MNQFANFNELQLTTIKNALQTRQRHLRQWITELERSVVPASRQTEVMTEKLQYQLELKTNKELLIEIDNLITFRKAHATS